MRTSAQIPTCLLLEPRGRYSGGDEVWFLWTYWALSHFSRCSGQHPRASELPSVFYLIWLNSAGNSSICSWGVQSGKWCSETRLRQSFLTTTPLRATEWARLNIAGRWANGMQWMCVCVGFVARLKLMHVYLWLLGKRWQAFIGPK